MFEKLKALWSSIESLSAIFAWIRELIAIKKTKDRDDARIEEANRARDDAAKSVSVSDLERDPDNRRRS